jgi:hypothetical protein
MKNLLSLSQAVALALALPTVAAYGQGRKIGEFPISTNLSTSDWFLLEKLDGSTNQKASLAHMFPLAPHVNTNNGPHWVTATGSTTPRKVQDRASESVNVIDYGAIPNDGLDDYAALTNAAARVTAGQSFIIPAGFYLLSQRLDLDLPDDAKIICEGVFMPTPAHSGTLIRLGSMTTSRDRYFVEGLRVLNTNGVISWPTHTCGIELVNLHRAFISRTFANGFRTNLYLLGTASHGFALNQLRGGLSWNALHPVYATATAGGWNNDNTLEEFAISHDTTTLPVPNNVVGITIAHVAGNVLNGWTIRNNRIEFSGANPQAARSIDYSGWNSQLTWNRIEGPLGMLINTNAYQSLFITGYQSPGTVIENRSGINGNHTIIDSYQWILQKSPGDAPIMRLQNTGSSAYPVLDVLSANGVATNAILTGQGNLTLGGSLLVSNVTSAGIFSGNGSLLTSLRANQLTGWESIGLNLGGSTVPVTGKNLEMRYFTAGDYGEIYPYNRTPGSTGYRPLRVDGLTLALNSGSGGNVGINTTTPAAKLDVNGSALFRSTITATGKIPNRPAIWDGSTNLTYSQYDFAHSNHTHSATEIQSGTLAPARLGSGTATNTTVLHGDSVWRAVTVGPHTHDAADTVSGIFVPARLGGGTANNTTVLHGDNVWRVPAVGAHTHSAADITAGILAPARLGTGTANETTILHGDNVWRAVNAGASKTTWIDFAFANLSDTSDVFTGVTGEGANYVRFWWVVPEDLDTTQPVILKRLKIRALGGDDNGQITFKIGMKEVADSMDSGPTSFDNVVTANLTPYDSAGGDVFTLSDVTLTGWNGITPGQFLVINVARAGDTDANDDDFRFLMFRIQYTRL